MYFIQPVGMVQTGDSVTVAEEVDSGTVGDPAKASGVTVGVSTAPVGVN